MTDFESHSLTTQMGRFNSPRPILAIMYFIVLKSQAGALYRVSHICMMRYAGSFLLLVTGQIGYWTLQEFFVDYSHFKATLSLHFLEPVRAGFRSRDRSSPATRHSFPTW